MTSPSNITVDGDGNVYVTCGSTLLKIPSGGGTPETFATGSYYEIQADSTGNVYGVNWTYHRIDKIAPDSGPSLFAGGGTQAEGTGAEVSFYPYAITIDSADNLYLIDRNNMSFPPLGRICKITPAAVVTTIAADIYTPDTIAADSAGYLYIECDNNITTLEKRTTDGTPVGDMVTGISAWLRLSAGRDGNVYAIHHETQRIYQIMPNGAAVLIVGTGGQLEVPFTFNPYDVAVDNNGVMYVTEIGSGRIYKIMPESNE